MVENFDDIGVDNLIPEYPCGSDITMVNTMYKYPTKNYETGKYDDGSITIIYRDNKTGELGHHIIKNPPYVFYYSPDIDPNNRAEYNRLFIERSKLQQIVVPYKDLEKNIAELTGNLDFYYDNIKMGNRYSNKQLHTLPNVFNSDMNINNHIRAIFDQQYTNNSVPITKSYFDIETDSIHMAGDFPELGECPINAISFLDQHNHMHTFLLRNPMNPLIEEFEKSINQDLMDELQQFVIDKVGGPKKARKFKVDNLKFHMYFFDEEIKLIRSLYKLIHKLKPMFLLAWNNAFDTPYIVERIKALGYDPADIMCDKDFEIKFVKYFIDEKNKNEYAERGDYYDVSMCTVILDQMIHFASRRKNQSNINSYRLDDIGEMVAKVKKLDYSHITSSIAMLPYIDYKTFVFYNIMDVIVQKCIEMKAMDLEYIYNKCLINNTMYQKGHRQTIYLVNRFIKEFLKDGYIMGNNCNLGNEKERIRGALVGDPKNTDDYAKLRIGNLITSIVDNLVDFDYKAMHPSMTLENNMAPNTQIGRIEIPNKVHDLENRLNVEVWHRQEDFAESITTQNIILLCSRWFGLANYKELMHDVCEYFNMKYNYDVAMNRSCIYKRFRQNDCVSFNPDLIGNFYRNPVIFRGHTPNMSDEIAKLKREIKIYA